MSKIEVFRPTHMNGLCVNVTLTDKDGNDIEIPTYFDDMTERASLSYSGHTENGKKNRTFKSETVIRFGANTKRIFLFE